MGGFPDLFAQRLPLGEATAVAEVRAEERKAYFSPIRYQLNLASLCVFLRSSAYKNHRILGSIAHLMTIVCTAGKLHWRRDAARNAAKLKISYHQHNRRQ